jgi:hypothetical protein
VDDGSRVGRRSGGKVTEGGGVILTRSVGFGVVDEEDQEKVPPSRQTLSRTVELAEAGGGVRATDGELVDALATWLGGERIVDPPPSQSHSSTSPPPLPPSPLLATPTPAATSLSTPSPPSDRPLRARASDESMDFADMMRSLGEPPASSPAPRSSSHDRRQAPPPPSRNQAKSGSGGSRKGLARLWPASS